MIYTVSHLLLEDYEHWKRTWQGNHPEHQEEGVRRQHLVRNPANPNDVAVIREFDDLDQARRYHQGETRRQRMRDARVSEYVDYYPEG